MRKISLIFLTLLLSMVGITALAQSFEAANEDGVIISYVFGPDKKELWVTNNENSPYSGNVVIPESAIYGGVAYPVTIIANYAFRGCTDLTSVTIPNSIKSIGKSVFYNCPGTLIINCNIIDASSAEDSPFRYSKFNKIVIGDKVTTISNYAFYECSYLTSLDIPNSVISIGNSAFYGCSSLNTITIGNGVTSIGEKAFANIPNLTDVYCYGDNPPTTQSNSFEGSYIQGVVLHVLADFVELYKNTGVWKIFKDIVPIYETPLEKCATPTIAFANGKLSFSCVTEGVEFVPSISLADIENCEGVDIFSVYRFSVYAKKEGYLDSDVASVNIDLNKLKGDMNNDGNISIADVVALVNIILGGSAPTLYYSVGTDAVTADNYTTANNAQQVNSLSAIPSTLLTVTNPGVYYILLPDQFEPEVGGVVYYNVTKLNVNIPSYSVYRTASLSSGVQIKRVNVGTSGSQIDYE